MPIACNEPTQVLARLKRADKQHKIFGQIVSEPRLIDFTSGRSGGIDAERYEP